MFLLLLGTGRRESPEEMDVSSKAEDDGDDNQRFHKQARLLDGWFCFALLGWVVRPVPVISLSDPVKLLMFVRKADDDEADPFLTSTTMVRGME